jgi:hypothetical protein
MNARFMTLITACALALAAFAVAPQLSAQSGAASSRGIFSTLKTGNMVELSHEDFGMKGILTYDDDAKRAQMKHRVKEIGHDYIVLEYDDRNGPLAAIAESRIPASRVIIVHLGKSSGATIGGGDDSTSDKPGKTKPGTTKGGKKLN